MRTVRPSIVHLDDGGHGSIVGWAPYGAAAYPAPHLGVGTKYARLAMLSVIASHSPTGQTAWSRNVEDDRQPVKDFCWDNPMCDCFLFMSRISRLLLQSNWMSEVKRLVVVTACQAIGRDGPWLSTR